ncbi:MAG: hypothetical protein V1837_00605 [Candidatus Woesearchaeota archaeon]
MNCRHPVIELYEIDFDDVDELDDLAEKYAWEGWRTAPFEAGGPYIPLRGVIDSNNKYWEIPEIMAELSHLRFGDRKQLTAIKALEYVNLIYNNRGRITIADRKLTKFCEVTLAQPGIPEVENWCYLGKL